MNLNSSLKDGRLRNQTYKLLHQQTIENTHPYIIIQGRLTDLKTYYYNKRIHTMSRTQYINTLASLNEKGIGTIPIESQTPGDLSETIHALIKHYNPDKKEVKEVLLKPHMSDYSAKCYYMIEGLGEQKSQDISTKYPLHKMITIPEDMEDGLTQIKGIGKKTAQKIIKTLQGKK